MSNKPTKAQQAGVVVASKASAEELLAALAEARAQAALLESDYGQLRDQIMKPIKAQLAELDAEFADKRDTVQHNAAALEALVRAAVIERGETVSTPGVSAVFVRGRESWDGKLLQGMSVQLPQILLAQKVGEPSVSIRVNNK